MRFGIFPWLSARFAWLLTTPPVYRLRRPRRWLGFEPLEVRAVMAGDFGAVFGFIYVDQTGGGLTPGEEVAGATVQLYRNDGDAVFEPGADDTLLATTLTEADGQYRFDALAAGDYWVEQPAQFADFHILAADVAAVQISAAQSAGVPGTLIDSFSTPAPSVVAADPIGTTDSGTADPPQGEVMGSERDLKTELTSSSGGQSVTLTVAAGNLSANPSVQAQGRYTVVWDGDDNDGSAIDHSGLGNLDLTAGGAMSAIVLENVFSDKPGSTVTLRVYSDSINSSAITINLPANVDITLPFQFEDFIVAEGAGANFTSVNAIELELNASVDAGDIDVDFVQVLGYSEQRIDFGNREVSDLSLAIIADDATPNLGDNVTLVITVTNSGPDTASNVQIESLLPAGVTFVSSLSSQGAYNETTRVWTVGSITAGNAVDLELIATVTTIGAKTLVAEVSSADESDPDSVPGNGATSEDDFRSVTVSPQAIDLSLAKTVNNPSVNVGSNVTFTVTVSNAVGMSNATGVVIADQLPTGFTFVSGASSQGTYDVQTGLWTVGTINPGANATLQIIATKRAAGSIINTAEVTAADQADIDSTPNNRQINPSEDDSAAVTVSNVGIDLSLTSSVNNAAPVYGQNVTFTLALSNTGAAAATGVSVANELPAGWSFVSANPSQGSYVGATGQWTVGAVNAGSSATLEVVAAVGSGGTKANIAEVSAADQLDVDSTPGNRAASPVEDDTTSRAVVVSLGNFGPNLLSSLQPFGTANFVGPAIQVTDSALRDSGGGADFNIAFREDVRVAVKFEIFVDGPTLGEGFWIRNIAGAHVGAVSSGAGGAPIAGGTLQNLVVYAFGHDAWLPPNGGARDELVFYASPQRTGRVETAYAMQTPLAADSAGGFHTFVLLIEPRANDTLYIGQFDGFEPITWGGPRTNNISSVRTIGAGSGIGPPQGVGEDIQLVAAYLDYQPPTGPPPTDPPPTDLPDEPATSEEIRPPTTGQVYGPPLPARQATIVVAPPPATEATTSTDTANVLAALPRRQGTLVAPQAVETETGTKLDGGSAETAPTTTPVAFVEEADPTDAWREHGPELPKSDDGQSSSPDHGAPNSPRSGSSPAINLPSPQSAGVKPQQKVPSIAGGLSRSSGSRLNDPQGKSESDGPGGSGEQEVYRPLFEGFSYFNARQKRVRPETSDATYVPIAPAGQTDATPIEPETETVSKPQEKPAGPVNVVATILNSVAAVCVVLFFCCLFRQQYHLFRIRRKAKCSRSRDLETSPALLEDPLVVHPTPAGSGTAATTAEHDEGAPAC